MHNWPRLTRRLAVPAVTALVLATATACSSDADGGMHHAGTSGMSSSGMSGMSGMSSSASSTGSMGMGGSGHTMDGGPAPAGITAAKNPTYAVGSKVVLTAAHMPGMKGARATVVGAYTTITYAVDYTPTTGGAMVKDHKWVVAQEIAGAGAKRLADGTAVVLTADHMPGMKGAKATIASSTEQTVYMVDYTAGGMTVKNHKWVVQDEMKPVG
ncbi:YdhK family protein [Calidifontibacter terrae]